MVRTRMISKNCPSCDQQIAIASKRCSCGYAFNGGRQANAAYIPPASVGRPKSSKKGKSSGGESRKAAAAAAQAASAQVQRRRTGRVRREKPNYYDSLQYEKKKKKSKKPTRSSLFKGKEGKQAQLIGISSKETQVSRANRHAQRRAKKEEIDGGGDLCAKLSLEKQEIALLILSEINRKIGSVVWKQP
ncbi:UPF0547 protein C16orf87 homolog [Topomyia yanbarensis]|uniref:UPF0547 protein C16orf87 homolog n=1 Tax=Topomyia yanbarensis TaxID=2498891 RepID=UPI00273AA959|nr:UPF0547 protein C16orf87 homolog [Topomyia yanbarensis]